MPLKWGCFVSGLFVVIPKLLGSNRKSMIRLIFRSRCGCRCLGLVFVPYIFLLCYAWCIYVQFLKSFPFNYSTNFLWTVTRFYKHDVEGNVTRLWSVSWSCVYLWFVVHITTAWVHLHYWCSRRLQLCRHSEFRGVRAMVEPVRGGKVCTWWALFMYVY